MNIKINDIFYRYIDLAGIFQYIVKGIRQYQDDQMYELEVQNCSHGYKCLLLCGINDKGKLQYIRAINDDEENSQIYWHTDAGEFYQTKKEALISKANRMIKYWDDELAKAEQKLKNIEEGKKRDVQAIQDMIDGLKE